MVRRWSQARAEQVSELSDKLNHANAELMAMEARNEKLRADVERLSHGAARLNERAQTAEAKCLKLHEENARLKRLLGLTYTADEVRSIVDMDSVERLLADREDWR